MWGFLSVVAICMTACWLEFRLAHRRREPGQVSVAPESVVAPSAPQPIVIDPMPVDLLRVAMMESETWAREAAIKSMYEMYEHCKDWKIVAANWKPFDTADQFIS